MQDYGGTFEWRRAGGLFQTGRDGGDSIWGSGQIPPGARHNAIPSDHWREVECRVPGGQGVLRIMQYGVHQRCVLLLCC